MKIINYKLPITKSIYVLVIFLMIYSLSVITNPAFAQESTPAANNKESTNSGILTKIEDLKKEIASKAADLKQEIDKRTQNKALMGKANVITTDSMTLDTKSGFKTIRLNEYTLYQNTSAQKSKRAFTKDDIKTDDQIVCLGDIDEKGIMTAKKIVKIDPIPSKKRNYILGIINNSDDKSITLHLKDGTSLTLQNDSKIIVRNGKDEGSIADIKTGKKAIILTNESEKVVFVYLSGATGIIKTNAAEKVGSPTATKR